MISLRTLTGLLAFATLSLFVSVAGAQTQAGLLWQVNSGLEGWNPSVISLGARGNLVSTDVGPFNDYTRSYSTFDDNPALPIFQFLNPHSTFHQHIDSAETNDLRITLYDEYADAALMTRRVFIKRYSFASPALNWVYTFPTLTNGHDSVDARISRDGQTIVGAVYNIWTGQTDVVVLGANSNVPLSTFSVATTGPFKAMRLSADGKKLYLASGGVIKILDIPSGAVLHTEVLFDTTFGAYGISGDGTFFAYGTMGAVKIFKRSPTTGLYSLNFTHTLSGTNYCNALAISDDGSTLAAGYVFYDHFLTVTLVAIDLASHAQTMSDTATGTGTFQNSVSAMAISANGMRIAAGLWGDQAQTVPQVRVYNRNQNLPIFSYTLPGSVNAIAISADGKRVGVASKWVHANISGQGGTISLFRPADEDFVLHGVPHAGATVTFELHSAHPGSPAKILYSSHLATSPAFFPDIGMLYIDRATISYLPMTAVNAAGVSTGSFQIPATTPPGTILYFQGFTASPRTLTNDWIAMLVVN